MAVMGTRGAGKNPEDQNLTARDLAWIQGIKKENKFCSCS